MLNSVEYSGKRNQIKIRIFPLLNETHGPGYRVYITLKTLLCIVITTLINNFTTESLPYAADAAEKLNPSA